MISRAMFLLVAVAISCPVMADDPPSHAEEDLLRDVPRSIAGEPNYRQTPRYALLAIGPRAQTRVWMIEDGDELYVDRNANGDLTDDGPPAPLSSAGYVVEKITGPDGSTHTGLTLKRWKNSDPARYGPHVNSYALQLNVDGRIPMYAGWFGSFWAADPQQVPVVHFGGPLTPKLLIIKQFVVADKMIYDDPRRLALSFVTPGLGEGAQSRLSIAAMPKSAGLTVQIDWPVAGGSSPLRTTHRLLERCCYWCCYDSSFQVPAAAAPGKAIITVSLEQGEFPLPLTTHTIEAPVLADPPAPQRR